MQKITAFLWFDNQVEDAVHFYASVCRSAKVRQGGRYGEAGPAPAGKRDPTTQASGQPYPQKTRAGGIVRFGIY